MERIQEERVIDPDQTMRPIAAEFGGLDRMVAAGRGAGLMGCREFPLLNKYLDIVKLLFGHLQLGRYSVDKLYNCRQ